jgi:hypothetical protein
VVYVRTDLLEAREVLHTLAHAASLEAALVWSAANPNTVRVSQYRNFGQWGGEWGGGIPSDNAALIGRQAAARYLSIVLAFGVCQARDPLERLCGKSVMWGPHFSPECILKMHLTARNTTNCAADDSALAELDPVALSRYRAGSRSYREPRHLHH